MTSVPVYLLKDLGRENNNIPEDEFEEESELWGRDLDNPDVVDDFMEVTGGRSGRYDYQPEEM